jgi:MHS family shikimate/dehydroshikimate transporter-like MFS transporter
MKRAVLASLLGATLEWYDFILYGVVAGIVFNRLFFPTGDAFVSTMLAYGTFAVGFVARPVGGIIFGHFGDRIGRKSMLVLTMMIMGASTVTIGLLPTYEQVGLAAPLLLLLLRVLQGVALGGEWGGAVLMAYEHAPPERRGLAASIPQIGLAIGLCLASGLVGAMSTVLTDGDFLAWGWRVGFLASAFLVALGLYVRLAVEESPAFRQARASGSVDEIPLFTLLRDHTGSVLLGMGARYIDGVFFNVFAVFSIGYLANTIGFPRSGALWAVSVAALAMVFGIPLFGALSDRIGRPRTYAIGSLLLALSAVPGFMAFQTGDAATIYATMIVVFGIVYAMCYGPEAALFSDLFGTEVRYTGISFVYQVSGVFASGITPLIAAYLFEVGQHQPWLICGYVVFAALVSMASALLIERRRGGSLAPWEKNSGSPPARTTARAPARSR